jgi:hypothetical protein
LGALVCASAGLAAAHTHHATDSAVATFWVRSRFRADRASLTVIVDWERSAKDTRRLQKDTGQYTRGPLQNCAEPLLRLPRARGVVT